MCREQISKAKAGYCWAEDSACSLVTAPSRVPCGASTALQWDAAPVPHADPLSKRPHLSSPFPAPSRVSWGPSQDLHGAEGGRANQAPESRQSVRETSRRRLAQDRVSVTVAPPHCFPRPRTHVSPARGKDQAYMANEPRGGTCKGVANIAEDAETQREAHRPVSRGTALNEGGLRRGGLLQLRPGLFSTWWGASFLHNALVSDF